MLLGDMSGENNAVDNGQVTQTTEAKPADVAEGAEQQPDTDNTQNTDEVKKRTGYQRKLDKKDAEIAQLRDQLNAKPAKAEVAESEPKLEDYETYEEHNRAMARYEARQAVKDYQSKQAETERETKLRTEQQNLQSAYKAKADDFRKVAPDFDTAFNDYDGPWNGMIQQALLESALGPQISYYLAKNLEEADKMEGMSLTQLNRFFGRIEAKLETQKPSVKPTQAQPPITPIRKGSAVSTKDPGDMTLSEFEEWERTRKK